MAATYLRGGIPEHINATTQVATVQTWEWFGGPANYLWFQNTGTGNIVLSFTRKAADAGEGVTIGSGEVFAAPTEIAGFYTQSAAAEPFEAVAFIHR